MLAKFDKIDNFSSSTESTTALHLSLNRTSGSSVRTLQFFLNLTVLSLLSCGCSLRTTAEVRCVNEDFNYVFEWQLQVTFVKIDGGSKGQKCSMFRSKISSAWPVLRANYSVFGTGNF